MYRLLMTIVALTTIVVSLTWAQSPSPSAIDIAQSYLLALDNNDLDVAGALFTDESSVFENGGNEGTWSHYREHHLQPEVEAIVSFKTTLGEPNSTSSKDGSMAVVTWPIEYHIELTEDRSVDSKGVVTFVLVRRGEEFRIQHLHWSSRRQKS